MTIALQQAILDFWFDAPGSAEYGAVRAHWFRKDATFDDSIRQRFGAAIDAALDGGFADWIGPRPALARVIVLDQFTRNCYRDSPRAFAGDALAVSAAGNAVDRIQDAALIAVERWFLYMPFQHAESLAAQERSLALFTRLRDETGLADPLPYAERHAEIVRRFGRFPHRNAVLDRASTTEEIAFLAMPGSGF